MEFSEWRDADFYSLPSQTTIHSLASMQTEKNTSKFLVSSMNGQFSSVEYQIGDKITPLMKNIPFSNLPLPGDAEIVGISVLERLPPKRGHVVGITYVIIQEQQDSLQKSQAFNVYSPIISDDTDVTTTDQLKLEVIAENCQSIKLTYIPYCLKNTIMESGSGETEPVFLISGSDYIVHVYKETPPLGPGQQAGVVEVVASQFFPEFNNVDSVVETIEIARPDSQHRVTALGFEGGQIEVYHVNTQTNQIVNTWSTSMDGPITSLHFFTLRKVVPVPPCLQNLVEEEEEQDPDLTNLHLLMTVHLHPAHVYSNVLNNGLSEVLPLPDSDKYDSAICSLALDVDFDGEHEVIVGTYGQELLIYKFHRTMEKYIPLSKQEEVSTVTAAAVKTATATGATPGEESSKHRHKSDEGNASEKNQNAQRKVKSQEDLINMMRERNLDPNSAIGGNQEGLPTVLQTVTEPHYRLTCQRPFPCPIMGLGGGDMMGDGVENLVVVTSFGIHILQPNINKLFDLVTQRMSEMADTVEESGVSDEFRKLQTDD